MEFENYIQNPSVLPQVQDDDFTAVEKKYKTILIINRFILFLLVSVPLTVLYFVNKIEINFIVFISVLVVLLLFLIVQLVILQFSFPIRGYLIREKDISYKHGYFVYRQTSVPYNRIQHVAIKQGFIEKIMKLASLKIYTAGGSSSDLSVSGLEIENAQKLKDYLSEKIANNE